jgi:hypothetical protein
MMRRHGRPRADCDGIGYGSMPYAGQRRGRSRELQMASGVDFDLFTGS